MCRAQEAHGELSPQNLFYLPPQAAVHRSGLVSRWASLLLSCVTLGEVLVSEAQLLQSGQKCYKAFCETVPEASSLGLVQSRQWREQSRKCGHHGVESILPIPDSPRLYHPSRGSWQMGQNNHPDRAHQPVVRAWEAGVRRPRTERKAWFTSEPQFPHLYPKTVLGFKEE